MVLKIPQNFAGKQLCQSFYFNKVACLRPATLLKKRLWNRCFPVNCVKFLKHLFWQNISSDCCCKEFSWLYFHSMLRPKCVSLCPPVNCLSWICFKWYWGYAVPIEDRPQYKNTELNSVITAITMMMIILMIIVT